MLKPSIVEAATRRAAASGALQPLETESLAIEDAGVRFVVRTVSSLARKQAARAPADALGDYEPELFVCPAAPGHYVLLNKHNVLPQHVLIVTRRFERGAQAGASQPRKHLQLVPMPDIPIESFLDAGGALPFRHACARIAGVADPAVLHQHYQDLLQACGLAGPPYNLLVTRRWMLLVPRAREVSSSGCGRSGR